MLFRIEDIENSDDGHHREYEIQFENLPRLKMVDLENYLAEEIRKEINNTHDRKLLSYSKSLGVCLLKYNKFTDNELHINRDTIYNCIYFYDLKNQNMVPEFAPFNLYHGLYDLAAEYKKSEIILQNYHVDVSDNSLLDRYLQMTTGIGRKKMASPEKDKEVVLMQSPNDIIISEYSDSVYLLYALVLEYGMKESIYKELMSKIYTLEKYRFEFCGEAERYGLLQIIEYLYQNGKYEREMSQRVLQYSLKSEHLSLYYDSILQLHGIQDDSFEDSYMLSDYNNNIVSAWIWHYYS